MFHLVRKRAAKTEHWVHSRHPQTLFVSAQAGITKYHWLGSLNNRHALSTVLEAGKSKIKVGATSVLHEICPPGLQMTAFSLCPHMTFPGCVQVEFSLFLSFFPPTTQHPSLPLLVRPLTASGGATFMTSSNLLLTQSNPPSSPNLITSHRFHLQIPSCDELQLQPMNVGEHKPSLHGRADDYWWHGQPYAGEGRRERSLKSEDERNDGLSTEWSHKEKNN